MKESDIFNPHADLTRLDIELKNVKQELEEAKELIEAIRTGAIDALAVQGENGTQVYTLKSADHTYRVLVEKMNEGAVILNKEGVILYCNNSFQNFLGKSITEIIGSSFFSIVPTAYTHQFQNIFNKAWNEASKGELMLQKANGAWIPYSFSMNAMELGDGTALSLIITDISSKAEIETIRSQVRRQNEIIEEKDLQLEKKKEAQKEADRLKFVLEGMPTMTWTNLPTGEVNFYNRRWYDYTGLTFDTSRDWGWKAVVHPEDLEQTLNSFLSALATGEIFEVENRYKRFDNTYRWHLNRAMPIKNESGDIILWVGTATDIDERKEALDNLARAKEQLRISNLDLSHKNEELIKINNDLDNFIYTASHDLKAPVSNIEGLVNTLGDVLSNEMTNDEVVLIFDLINKSIEKFKNTILDLTEITKIQKGDGSHTGPQNICEIIEDVRLSIADSIHKSNAEIIVDSTSCPTITFSKKNLKSIVYNLLSNAIKYRSPDRNPKVLITTRKAGDYVILTIEDNGLGMNITKESKIFSMFKRLHDHVEGTGIGLYLVKRIIDNAGGKIELESEVGKGTIFKVHFRDE